MLANLTEFRERQKVIDNLLQASRQDGVSALKDMLAVIARAADAFGTIMWEVAPGADLQAQPPSGRLFVLGSWFENPNVRTWYLLRVADSFTGSAILSGSPKFSPVLEHEGLTPAWAKKALAPFDVQSHFSVPICLLQSGARAAINVYWNRRVELSPLEQEGIASLCTLVPHLYAGMVDRVCLNLVQEVDAIIRKRPAKEAGTVDISCVLQQAVNSVASVFNCREAVIFLTRPEGPPGRFQCYAKNWEWPSVMRRTEYEADCSLTGYAAKTTKPVRILDLALYDEDLAVIQKLYEGIRWNHGEALKADMRQVLNYGPNDDFPPLSFMAAPITSGDRVLGVIRCCVAKAPPYFFDDRQVGALQVAARSIGAWWDDWTERNRTESENALWEQVIKHVGQLNGVVHRELTKREPSEATVFQETMRIGDELIGDVVASDVRLKIPGREELYIAETSGPLWQKGGQREIQDRKGRVFPLAGPDAHSGSAHVFRTKRPHIIENTESDANYDATFPDVKKVILSPLVCGKDVYGTLGFRRKIDRTFSDTERVIVELLANQLGLYHFLAEEIKELNRSKGDLRKSAEAQRRTYEDFQHQVRSPIIQASRLVQDVVAGLPQGHNLREKLLAVQGLCAQAERVARSLELFVSLAQDQPINARPKYILRKTLVQMLLNGARDHQAVMPPYRGIRFEVDAPSFQVLDKFQIRVDTRFLEQAINNLLDNAGKYSYSNTVIRIYGGLMENGTRFFIAVSNQGLKISGEEVKIVVQRGRRGKAAEAATAEGRGIGLWIVSKIMEAHKGRLVVTPTTSGNVTEVRLVFRRADPGGLDLARSQSDILA